MLKPRLRFGIARENARPSISRILWRKSRSTLAGTLYLFFRAGWILASERAQAFLQAQCVQCADPKTPTQHCVHPGRHASHLPLRRVASASAASTI
jgi:hypothetical protein